MHVCYVSVSLTVAERLLVWAINCNRRLKIISNGNGIFYFGSNGNAVQVTLSPSPTLPLSHYPHWHLYLFEWELQFCALHPSLVPINLASVASANPCLQLPLQLTERVLAICHGQQKQLKHPQITRKIEPFSNPLKCSQFVSQATCVE